MPQLGPTELIIVLVLVIIIFGVGKLPEVGGALGKSIKEFRKANVDEDEARAAQEEAERKQREEEVNREVERRVKAEQEAKESAPKEAARTE